MRRDTTTEASLGGTLSKSVLAGLCCCTRFAALSSSHRSPLLCLRDVSTYLFFEWGCCAGQDCAAMHSSTRTAHHRAPANA